VFGDAETTAGVVVRVRGCPRGRGRRGEGDDDGRGRPVGLVLGSGEGGGGGCVLSAMLSIVGGRRG
jgi:hypothetical protein